MSLPWYLHRDDHSKPYHQQSCPHSRSPINTECRGQSYIDWSHGRGHLLFVLILVYFYCNFFSFRTCWTHRSKHPLLSLAHLCRSTLVALPFRWGALGLKLSAKTALALLYHPCYFCKNKYQRSEYFLWCKSTHVAEKRRQTRGTRITLKRFRLEVLCHLRFYSPRLPFAFYHR